MSAGALSCGTDAVRPRRLSQVVLVSDYLRWSEKRKEPDMPGGREVTEEIEDAVQANKVIASSLRCLPSSWRWRQQAANGRRRQQLAKTLRRPTCGLFIKLRPFVPAHY